MVNQANTNVTRDIDKLNEKDNLAVSGLAELLSSRKPQKDNLINDEVIVSLSDAYENKRARQVTEWERLRRQAVRRSA
jgi:hypothetical protein